MQNDFEVARTSGVNWLYSLVNYLKKILAIFYEASD